MSCKSSFAHKKKDFKGKTFCIIQKLLSKDWVWILFTHCKVSIYKIMFEIFNSRDDWWCSVSCNKDRSSWIIKLMQKICESC